jgi:hypothetical protein
MATIPKTGISTGQAITATQILNIIQALDGTDATDIVLDGIVTLNGVTQASTGTNVLTIDGSGRVYKTGSYSAGGSGGSVSITADNSSTEYVDIQVSPSPITGTGTVMADLNATGTPSIDNVLRGNNTWGIPTTASFATTSSYAATANNAPDATSLGTTPSTVNIGPSSARLTLNSTGILNTDKAYFYGNSGIGALNVGISALDTDDANNRAFFNVDASTSLLRMRGLNGSTQTSASFTNFGTYTSLSSGNVGSTFFIQNDFSTTNTISFGNSKTSNGKAIIYLADNSDNSRPGSSGGSKGGLLVSHTLELGGTKGYKVSGTTWDTTSDSRLKENITTASLDTCYNVVKNLPLKRFNYIENYSKYPIGDYNQLGWIAQDVSGSLPKAVQSSSFITWSTYSGSPITASDGISIINNGDRVQDTLAGSQVIENTLSLDSDQILKMMYGTIQKLQQKVEALEAQINGGM